MFIPSSSVSADEKVFTSRTIGAKFVLIQAGTFMMGAPKGEELFKNEHQHLVTISKPFYMMTTEVTQGQWRKVMENNPSRFKDCGDDCPVEQISWNDVQLFIKKLNKIEGTSKYRLPTEAEWEYAARAGTTTHFYWGNDEDCSMANYGSIWAEQCKGKNPGRTMKVGSFSPNAWGLYDMHGNVWEVVQDHYGEYPVGHVTDPTGPSSGDFRVDRGGSWSHEASKCRSATRSPNAPDGRHDVLGFRLVRDK
jgi:formylglycine-generating enzyme required for sulfatase activity